MLIRLFFLLFIFGLSSSPSLMAQVWSAEMVWQVESSDQAFGGVELSDGVIYSGNESGEILALTADTGNVVWKAQVDGAVGSSVSADDKRVFLHTRDGAVKALDKQTGEHLWTFQTSGERKWDYWDYTLSTPVADDRQLYFGSGDHHIYALNKRSGELRWKFQTENIVHTRAAVSGEKVILGGYDGHLYALDRGTGRLIWTFKTVGNDYFRNGEIPAAALVDDKRVYVGSRDYNIYALLTDTGTGAWNDRSPSWIVGQPLVMGNALITVNSDGAAVRSYNKLSGKLNWEMHHSYNMFAGAVPILDKNIAVAGLDGRISFLNIEDGTILASWDTPARQANHDRFFDDEGKVDYSGIKSLEDLHGQYEDFLKYLGGIPGQLASNGDTLYFASGDMKIGAIRLTLSQ